MKRGIRDWGLGIGSVRQRRRPDRAGYALVLFVMMFFGLMGLAALVIDLGFARLAQRQMQTAVDSAALEGLRWRDVKQWEDLPQGWLADPDFQAQVGDTSGGTFSATTRDGSPLGRQPSRCRWLFHQWIFDTAKHVRRLRRRQRWNGVLRFGTGREFQRWGRSRRKWLRRS